MIPKIIHYCWFGGKPLTAEAKRYIATWRGLCPDYEIIEWNEQNFDVTQNIYCREAYEAKKWAFVSDYARLKVLYDHGGIYMDTDVEVVKSFNDLLDLNGFMCFESKKGVSVGTLGASENNPLLKEFLQAYAGKHFPIVDHKGTLLTNLQLITPVLVNSYGLKLDGKRQTLNNDIIVFPMEVFIAKSYFTGWIECNENTYAIHHYAESWVSEEDRQYHRNLQSLVRAHLKKGEWLAIKLAIARLELRLNGFSGLCARLVSYLGKRLGWSNS
ncbi:MAG: glycosyl transferase [Selenomonadaceae bacterium]|nr:glycosyl transferase [Selenomonadaceae bacterium]